MNINTVKRAAKRFSVQYLSMLNLQSYGADNIYPQRMRDLIANSSTGGICVDRYQRFIEGNGFNDTNFSEYICNRYGETIDDIHHRISLDLAYYHGFALHVNYNMACEICELQHVPFQNTRLEEENDEGHVLNIAVHPDWTGRKTRKGKRISIDVNSVEKIHVFNPKRDVVMAQIIAAGGIENYKGQILWVSLDGLYEYPKPIYDKVVTNLSTDEALDNVKYRNTRNNFLIAGMLCRKKGGDLGIDENGKPIKSENNDKDFAQSLDIFQGDMNCCTIMDVTVNANEDYPEFKAVEGNNFDKKFTCTEDSVTSRIYSAFGQEPWLRIRTGDLGFSGKIIEEAYEYYNSFTDPVRRVISRAFKRIFSNWFELANPSQDYLVQPLVYITNESNATLSDTARGSKTGSADRKG